MAIGKSIDLPKTGVSINYWRVDFATIGRDYAIIGLEGFLNKAAADEGKQPLAETRKTITITDDPEANVRRFTQHFSEAALGKVGCTPITCAYGFLASTVAADIAFHPYDLRGGTTV